ncbi:MAG: hypothetical protein HZB50_10760 [Chloroflexi bacterium]|nr:hypothetical protein [Chloroflexota bacterium]
MAILTLSFTHSPEDLSFIDKNIYVLDPPYEIIYALDKESGEELGSLQIALFPFSIETDPQKMVSTGVNLVFIRGCEIFVYGK